MLYEVITKSEESHLLHYPNLKWTNLQSESMGIPLLKIESNSNETKNELDLMKKILVVITSYSIHYTKLYD